MFGSDFSGPPFLLVIFRSGNDSSQDLNYLTIYSGDSKMLRILFSILKEDLSGPSFF